MAIVAEPPKLYGPHAPVIVPKASDGDACVPDNLKSLSGVLGEPRIINIFLLRQDQQWSWHDITALITKITYIEVRKSYNISYKTY
jgi:hypothetical protein